MKYKVGFRELGGFVLGCHGNDLQWLDGVFNTKEEAEAAIREDMDAALKQYLEGYEEGEMDNHEVDRDNWEISGSCEETGDDFRCAWEIREIE